MREGRLDAGEIEGKPFFKSCESREGVSTIRSMYLKKLGREFKLIRSELLRWFAPCARECVVKI